LSFQQEEKFSAVIRVRGKPACEIFAKNENLKTPEQDKENCNPLSVLGEACTGIAEKVSNTRCTLLQIENDILTHENLKLKNELNVKMNTFLFSQIENEKGILHY
jgi:hypothetical protein